MSKQKKITPRRQQPAKEGNILRAITKKNRAKKHRAVAANPASFRDEDSGLANKIVWGLFLLLAFHVVAIGAIILHSKYQEGSSGITESSPSEPAVVVNEKGQTARERIQQEVENKVSLNEPFAWIRVGDTYQVIADREGVDVEELKALNNNRHLKAGKHLKVPHRKVKVVSPELENIGKGNNLKVKTLGGDVQVITDGSYEIEVSSSQQQTAAQSNYNVHTFAKGETFWSLSKKYNISVEAIKNANPKINPTKIRVGDKINIPQ